ncbi:hydroxylamine oxidase [candidate division KSB1 bacterium]|nr:hydroxylamine oxidase [candidate division KSB1 bacterium]
MKSLRFYPILFILIFTFVHPSRSQELHLSVESEECLTCHAQLHPGLVASWYESRHSKITPQDALKKEALERHISSDDIKADLLTVKVGCYECHGLNTAQHRDAFEHNGYTINVVVSSNDCAACHAVEAEQYADNLMAHAHGNLVENAVYSDLMRAINNPYQYTNGFLVMGERDSLSEYESCLYCHGSKVLVKGLAAKETDFGELTFPVLEGWPNQGVGRVNPDGSLGACTACHPRHDFSIETARKPYTCSECHKGPDVPAFKVYEVSKHGNMFKSASVASNFDAVPWVVSEDFSVPTCATCHASLIVSPDNTVIAERTHQYSDRLSWRLFGVPYAHPHPQKANLREVKNSQGLPLITELTGEPVAKFVISAEEQQERNTKMKSICKTCHGSTWVDTHFIRLDHTVEQTNAITLEATKILTDLWTRGYAQGLPQGKNIFDEAVERIWTDIWLFHTNSTRFASAMAGGGDYGVFANGRYQTSERLYALMEKLRLFRKMDGE